MFSSNSLHCSLKKAFLSLLAILWNSAFNWVYLSFSPLPFASLLFTAIYKASSDLLTEKAMALHSSTLAWKIPWTEEPGPWGRKESDTTERLHFHFSLSTFMHWRRKWQPTPVFLPGESQGWGSLVGCRLWGRTESDTTEAT